jgi:hypothetical protein
MSESSEIRLVRTFVVPAKVDRYVGFLKKQKTRSKFLKLLYHFDHFDCRFVRQIAPKSQTAERILHNLLSMSAPRTCHLISANPDLDGLACDLGEAVRQVVGECPGTIVVCDPVRLAYYEGEHSGNRFVLSTAR